MKERHLASFLKIFLLAVIPLAFAVFFNKCSTLIQENERLKENQNILLHNGKVEIGKTASGKSKASVDALQLKTSDLGHKPDSLLAVTQKELKIKNSRVVAGLRASTSTMVDIKTAITDSIDTCQGFSHPGLAATYNVSWSDPWVTVRGTIKGDSFRAHIESRDTLQFIIHRVPKKFLFFRFGTKAVRMEVVSQNPHTQLSYPRLMLFTK